MASGDRWLTRVALVFLSCASLFIGWATAGRLASGVGFGLPGGDRPVVVTTPEPIAGSVLLLNDGVTIVYSDPDGLCRNPKLTVFETPTRVVLALTEDNAELHFCSVQPPRSRLAATTSLTRPLGTRALVDARTGRAVPYFDQSRELYLDSTTLPARWTQDTNPPYADASTDAAFFGGPEAAVLVQTYESLQTTAAGEKLLSHLRVVQVTGGGWHPPSGTVTTPIAVRGHAGLASAGIIVWAESDMTVAVIGYGPQDQSAWSMTDNAGPLPTAQLIDIADHLYRGGS